MNILAIETSCDETAIALIEANGGIKKPRFKVLKNFISSQIEIHRPFGGVVPNLAKREHIKNLPILLLKVKSRLSKVDCIAVTAGPGLEPALWAGIEFAKQLRSSLIHADKNADQRGNILKNLRQSASSLRKSAIPELVGVNHMEGHLYSFLLQQKTATIDNKLKTRNSRLIFGFPPNADQPPAEKSIVYSLKFPAIALVVSGGHTILLKMDSLVKWKKLGETRDDAAGEAFDKVARLLGLSYPGGPEIAHLAQSGNSKAINFPRPMLNQKNYDFSFSGLKTAVFYYLRDHLSKKSKTSPSGYTLVASGSQLADVAASFEKAVTDVLTHKTMRAVKEFQAQSIILCGGVAANKWLRKKLNSAAEEMGISFHCPNFEFNTDNAAMIAAAAYMRKIAKKKGYKLEADSNLTL